VSVRLRRVPAGAHYGVRDWLIQRVTAVLVLLYVLALAVSVLLAGHLDYNAWAGVFAPLPMKLATLLAVAAIAWHAWIGVRDVWMDYIRPTGLRLALHVATVVWLAYCLAWAAQIVWSV
jgi:succinate dehydrogenase / fumarate reductase, membrane anchor subunit